MLLLTSVYNNASYDSRIEAFKHSGSPDGDNLGLHLVAQSLRTEGLEARIIDARRDKLTPSKTFDKIKEHIKVDGVPDAFGLSCEGLGGEHAVIELTSVLKMHFPDIPIVVGGYVTLEEDLMARAPGIDVLFKGEGEDRSPAVFEALKARDYEALRKVPGLVVKEDSALRDTGKAPRVTNLDRVLPDYNIFWSYRIYSARNCRGRCTYCFIGDFYNGNEVIAMSDSALVKTVKSLMEAQEARFAEYKEYREKLVSFSNDNFVHKSGIIDLLAPVVAEQGYKLSFQLRADDAIRHFEEIRTHQENIHSVSLGIESFSNKLLRFWRKGTTAAKNLEALELLSQLKEVGVTPFFMMDHEHDDEDIIFNALYGAAFAPVYVYRPIGFGLPKAPFFFDEEGRGIKFTPKTPYDKKSPRLEKVLDTVSELNRRSREILEEHRSNYYRLRDTREVEFRDRYMRAVEEAIKIEYVFRPILECRSTSNWKSDIDNAPRYFGILSNDVVGLGRLLRLAYFNQKKVDLWPLFDRRLEELESNIRECREFMGHLKQMYPNK